MMSVTISTLKIDFFTKSLSSTKHFYTYIVYDIKSAKCLMRK